MQEDLRLKNNDYWSCGFHFFKAGLWYFIIGIILGFGVLIHYLVGSAYNNTGDFLSNITLWFGSPLSLSSAYIQLGGLGMAVLGAVGAAGCLVHRHTTDETAKTACSKKKHASLTLCHIGLILLFITGYIGYFIIDMIWPGFYYGPIPAGKNLWLILQGISILIYLIGFIMATCCLCTCKKDHHHREVPNQPTNIRP